MKKGFLLSIALFALGTILYAQPARPGAVPPPTRYNVSFESQHGESFTVFIDGDRVNRMPQSRVLVNDIGDQTHEVIVVLKRPAEKAAVMMLRPGEPNVTVNINYDIRQEMLHLYTPAYNRPDGDRERRFRRERPDGPHVDEFFPPIHHEHNARMATDDDVDMMVMQLKAQSFDNERLALAKTLVSSAHFTSAQIARMGQTIDFSNSQVDFLKYAYSYCSDPVNYSRAIEILTFNSDRKKVTDYIATQR
ncbi:MAG: DUF4476 domain-containing protein [Bacteroidales bacterium]|nr:DUF4476 domain-containing protein [Bacteroidales bacterium]